MSEREQIVAWLRQEAEMRFRLADDHPDPDCAHYNRGRGIAVEACAEAIERGDHLPKEP